MAAAALLLGSCGADGPTAPPSPGPSSAPAFPTIAAAGDISCAPGTPSDCRQMDTAAVLEAIAPDVVLALGDTQYPSGALAHYLAAYAPSWGRLKAVTHPVPGNHEYQTRGAQGYFDYFNGIGARTGPAGDRDRGYYDFRLGSWHLIALNTNCAEVRGCHAGSPQEVWLRQTLSAVRARCTLAYFHYPLFSSGPNDGTSAVRPLWQALYDHGAEVVLNGHEHSYERFAPQTPQGVEDQERGIRQFVVGTGGYSLTPFVALRRNSEERNARDFGVLRLELLPDGYGWKFVSVAGGAYYDAGFGACH